MNRERLLIVYCLMVGGIGWLWLALTPPPPTPLFALLLFGAIALSVDTLSFRVPPTDAHSMGGLVLVMAALALGPAPAALLAAWEGLLSGALLPFVYRRPRSVYLLLARPFLRGGVRAVGILGGAALASAALGAPQYDPATLNPEALLLWTILCSAASLQLGRIGREYLQGGRSGVTTWWRSTWRLALGVELAPLPLALLGAAIYLRLGVGYFCLAGLALIAAAVAVRRASVNLLSQRRSVRELAMLNEASRAIIRSELDAEALCELIYREASKVIDTGSFHLGLFDGSDYTLMVRVQDRVRLPRLTVDLAAGDGIIGWIRQTGRALLVEDFAQEMSRLPARPRYQSERPPRSGIYVPLIAGEDVIGSISVQSYQPSAFGANDLRMLSLIADQAAVAITRARAFRQASQRAIQLQAIHEVSEQITAILNLEELLPSIVRLIREHFGYHPVHIFTIDDGGQAIRFRASTADLSRQEIIAAEPMRLGQGVVGSAAASRAAVLVGDVRLDPRYIRDAKDTRSELAVPLRIGEHVIGVLDVQSDQVSDFDADDLFVMQTLAGQIAVAIDSANTYTAQQEQAWTLNALLQMSENIGRASTLDTLLSTVVRMPPLLLGCSRCYCLLWVREGHFALLAAYGLPGDLRDKLVGQPVGLDAAPLLARLRAPVADGEAPTRPLVLPRAQSHPAEWPQLIGPAGSGTLVALPMLARASLLGALIFDWDDPDIVLDSRQINLSTGAAAQVAGALESLLLAREAEEAGRMEQELRVAREIQTALLPAHPPQIAGWQIDAAWRSARLVGGDFYDFWPLRKVEGRRMKDEDRAVTDESLPDSAGGDSSFILHPSSFLGFVIADVSDKGVPAAMFMAMSRSLVRAAALDGSAPPAAMERANRWITRDSESGMFVTLFYGLLDTESGRLRYTSAGHNPPLLYRPDAGTFDELRTPGIALGVLEEISLSEAAISLDPGDVLVCYTDGVTEAIDDAQREFGVERLRGVIAAHAGEDAPAIVRAIVGAVDQHGRAPTGTSPRRARGAGHRWGTR
ncbi:SpoIIE family protein phosphatase [Oscillochloris sp. ZM17-4]|uniref:SpoIIE family protein phosphatase n=1 Tax=Oscillochloris sp. ZM17-4 TaxID=2866714 RepID=UPI001C73E015|nr:SpoIIE family protein phosphatase [Oscillochloris sp. ZM17-4]MBX0328617.1 SpoIIE family protein phosphatase [Oscillochloris sp. ZM17-4]